MIYPYFESPTVVIIVHNLNIKLNLISFFNAKIDCELMPTRSN